MLTPELQVDCSCSVAVSGGFDKAKTDLNTVSQSLASENKVRLYEYIRDNCCRPETEWRAAFRLQFEIADDQLPPDQCKDNATLIGDCVSRHVAATDDATQETLATWTQTARTLDIGIMVTNLVFDAHNGFGIVYSPYGSIEPQHKWGVVSKIESEEPCDHVWCDSLADCCQQLQTESMS